MTLPVEVLRDARRAELARRLAASAGVRDYPLSFAQQRLWFLSQWEPNSAFYNSPRAYRVGGPLRVDALERAWNEIVRRHDSLRTTFTAVAGLPTQRVSPFTPFPLEQLDLRELAQDAREEEAARLLREEALRPFDLTRGPLWRLRLIRLGQEDSVLQLTVHHIVSDAWSIGVFFRELEVLYRAFSLGSPSPLPELSLQYPDFSIWQRGWLQGDVLRTQLDYWRQRLGEPPPTLNLPVDRSRPAVQTYRGANVVRQLPEALAAALESLGRSSGVTPFMTLLAAYQTLLLRYTGEEDIAVGSPIANRNRAETENLIGFFVNTLVFRTDLSGNPTFRELLERIREVALGAYDHQDLPFEEIVARLQPRRTLSQPPFFQVFFNLLGQGEQRLRLEGVTLRRWPVAREMTKFDVSLAVTQRGARWTASLAYNTDLFHRATVARMMDHFQKLLEGIVADPALRLSRFPMLSSEERRALGAAGNAVRPPEAHDEVPAANPTEQSLAEKFLQQVRRHGPGIAVKTRRHEWSYERLDAEAERVARALASLPGPPGRVALLCEHGAPMLAAILGTLKAGGTYVPLDPGHPRPRLELILSDADVGALLTTPGNRDAAGMIAPRNLPVVVMEEGGELAGADRFAPTPDPSSLAYLLYTSGSTGQPKGVMQTHRNVLHFIRAYANGLAIGPGDRVSLLAPYGFDAAVMDIFGALLNGAALFPFDVKEEGLRALAGWLRAEKITILHAVPTLYRSFLASLTPSDRFPSVRLVVLGGEEAYKSDLDNFRKHFEQETLFVNLFGSTESSLSALYIADSRATVTRASIPLGYPVDATAISLLDRGGEPTDLCGEIAVRSAHVAPGYWRQPDLTRSSFLPDPEGGASRTYRTGDLGRYMPDGALEFLGRRDAQLKIRGFRVEASEVESALARHPGVRQAAVLAREDSAGERRLVAHVVAAEGHRPSAASLRELLASQLPDYMVPSAFVLAKTLPLTATGKLDRRALAALPASSIEAGKVFVALRSPLEKALGRIWQEVLRRESVGALDNFFDLGGHSLLAIQAMARLQTELGVDLPLRVLFERPTIGELAAVVAVKQMEQIDPGELSRLLSEVEGAAMPGAPQDDV